MDCDGHPENVVSRDEMLDDVMVYWCTATGASSARLYWESPNPLPEPDITVPVAGSIFPGEITTPSRRWAEARFPTLAYYNVLEKGGHFAAFEQPQIFVDEVRAGFRTLREHTA